MLKRSCHGTGQLVERLLVRLRSERSEVQILHGSNRTQCCQKLATTITVKEKTTSVYKHVNNHNIAEITQ